MFAAMTDLFMNFALALVWVLFVMPAAGSDLLREQVDPEQANEGSAPAAGLSVATVTLDGRTGSMQILYKNEEQTWEEFGVTGRGKDFPDHLIFRFLHFPEFEELAEMALVRDSAISLKLRKKAEEKP